MRRRVIFSSGLGLVALAVFMLADWKRSGSPAALANAQDNSATASPVSRPTASSREPPPTAAPTPVNPNVDEAPQHRTGEWCELDESWMDRSRDEARQRIPVYYEDLAAQLGLSREENDRIQALLVEQYAELNLPYHQLCTDLALLRQRRRDTVARHRAALVAAIGPQRVAAFDKYTRSLDARVELYLVNWALGFDKLSLSESQRKALLQRLMRPGALMPEREYAEGESAEALRQEIESWMDQNDQLVLAAARGVLEPAQMAAYERFVGDRRENWIRAEFWRAGVKPPPPPEE